jgi:PIN domain nuclease of toxin-antitoxin system
VTLLLDTHVILWWQRDDRRLGKAARRAIAQADLVLVSAVSGWEVAIKMALAGLPPHHADPFDRALAAQARVERATLVSHDRALGAYGVPVIWT